MHAHIKVNTYIHPCTHTSTHTYMTYVGQVYAHMQARAHLRQTDITCSKEDLISTIFYMCDLCDGQTGT